MIIGIIGAMDEELFLLKNKIANIEKDKNQIFDIYIGKYRSGKVIFMKSGIGKVNAALAAHILINEFQVDIIINTGIAGSLCNEIKIGDVVISTNTQQYDVDVTAFGYEKGIIPRMDTSIFEADKNLIQLIKNMDMGKTSFHFGRIISGDNFISNYEKKKQLQNDFQAYCVDMESASIGHVCHLYKIPYIAIRCISDDADESSKDKYKDFDKYAANISSNITLNLINSI